MWAKGYNLKTLSQKKQEAKELQANNAQKFSIQEAIDSTYAKMEREKNERGLIIPKKFIEFVHSKQMYDFLDSIMDYFRELFRLQSKQREIEMEAKQRGMRTPPLLDSETRKLNLKAKKMGMNYAWIIYKNKSSLNSQKDQNFYETLMFFCGKALKGAFEKDQIREFDIELNRLFRTNAFNMSQREKAHQQQLKKHPFLQQPQGKETIDQLITRLEQRFRVPVSHQKDNGFEDKEHIKPLYSKVSSYGAANGRSPLLSLVFPTYKDRILLTRQQGRYNKKQLNKSVVSRARTLLSHGSRRMSVEKI